MTMPKMQLLKEFAAIVIGPTVVAGSIVAALIRWRGLPFPDALMIGNCIWLLQLILIMHIMHRMGRRAAIASLDEATAVLDRAEKTLETLKASIDAPYSAAVVIGGKNSGGIAGALYALAHGITSGALNSGTTAGCAGMGDGPEDGASASFQITYSVPPATRH